MKNYIVQSNESAINITIDDNINIIKLSTDLLGGRIDRSWICTKPGTYVYEYKGETRQVDVEAGDLILKMYSPNDDWLDKRLVILKGNDSLKDYAIEYSETCNKRKEAQAKKYSECTDNCETCCPA